MDECIFRRCTLPLLVSITRLTGSPHTSSFAITAAPSSGLLSSQPAAVLQCEYDCCMRTLCSVACRPVADIPRLSPSASRSTPHSLTLSQRSHGQQLSAHSAECKVAPTQMGGGVTQPAAPRPASALTILNLQHSAAASLTSAHLVSARTVHCQLSMHPRPAVEPHCSCNPLSR